MKPNNENTMIRNTDSSGILSKAMSELVNIKGYMQVHFKVIR